MTNARNFYDILGVTASAPDFAITAVAYRFGYGALFPTKLGDCDARLSQQE